MNEKMNPEVKAKWIEALESGKYEQGKHYLNCDGKFCCLGVLTDLAAQEGIGEWQEREGLYDHDGLGPQPQPLRLISACEPTAMQRLNQDTAEWAGLDCCDPIIKEEYAQRLSYLNDRSGKNFKDIAEIIRKHL